MPWYCWLVIGLVLGPLAWVLAFMAALTAYGLAVDLLEDLWKLLVG